jgi:long-chain acyl-CoA synthetase
VPDPAAAVDAAHALRIIAEHRVTVFEGVPTMYVALLHQPDRADYDTSSLRMCLSGGAALPVEVLRGFEEAFGVPLLGGYGLSETSPVASFNHPDREQKPGSIGTPIRDVRMRVVDGEDHEVPQGEVGEIVIRGPNVMKGYWQRPEATAEAIRDGWFHSGDLARVDEDGYFYIVDRKEDLIIRGGYNVYRCCSCSSAMRPSAVKARWARARENMSGYSRAPRCSNGTRSAHRPRLPPLIDGDADISNPCRSLNGCGW